jgi:hypothetical protein
MLFMMAIKTILRMSDLLEFALLPNLINAEIVPGAGHMMARDEWVVRCVARFL